jgi:beta-phosphoglucomutase-like phosphatase (HAD superfamily)
LVRDIVGNSLTPEQVLAIEDTHVGALAAQRAGCRVLVCPQDGGPAYVDNVAATSNNMWITSSIHDSIKYIRP